MWRPIGRSLWGTGPQPSLARPGWTFQSSKGTTQFVLHVIWAVLPKCRITYSPRSPRDPHPHKQSVLVIWKTQLEQRTLQLTSAEMSYENPCLYLHPESHCTESAKLMELFAYWIQNYTENCQADATSTTSSALRRSSNNHDYLKKELVGCGGCRFQIEEDGNFLAASILHVGLIFDLRQRNAGDSTMKIFW